MSTQKEIGKVIELFDMAIASSNKDVNSVASLREQNQLLSALSENRISTLSSLQEEKRLVNELLDWANPNAHKAQAIGSSFVFNAPQASVSQENTAQQTQR